MAPRAIAGLDRLTLACLLAGAVCLAFAIVGAIFGEWVGSSEGLGWLLIQDRAQFDTAGAFAVMVLLNVLGISLFVLVSALERVCLPWYHDERRRDALLGRGK